MAAMAAAARQAIASTMLLIRVCVRAVLCVHNEGCCEQDATDEFDTFVVFAYFWKTQKEKETNGNRPRRFSIDSFVVQFMSVSVRIAWTDDCELVGRMERAYAKC